MPFSFISLYHYFRNNSYLEITIEIQENAKVSVLVVDDDPAVSKLIRQNLECNDTKVTEAATGLEGIQALLNCEINLVILDIKLPDVSGWGILSMMRLTEALCRIPVIIASVEPPETAPEPRLKPDYHIRKPFDINDLLGHVWEITRSKRAG